MTPFPSQTGHHHLQRLIALRLVFILALSAVLALAGLVFDLRLPWLPLTLTLAFPALFALLTWLRLGNARPVSNHELFAQLCLDVLALTALLYFSGGSTNPFISLFLLPLVIAAATLPRGYTWGMAGLTTLCYTLLMKYYLPLVPQDSAYTRSANAGAAISDPAMQHMHHDGADAVASGHAASLLEPGGMFNLHVLGMWLGFVLSAGIISWFVVRMAQAVRDRDAELARAREETLRNERIVALGTLSASAAHEMGTPLSTMAVVVGELRHEKDLPPDWQHSLDLMDGQLRNCRRILDKMLDDGHSSSQPLPDFLHATLEEFRLLRPATECRYQTPDLGPATSFSFDPALRPALLNLLNNAADASPRHIEVIASRKQGDLVLTIHDHGPGISPENAAHVGTAFFSTKREGRGLGLFLANATLERMGGKVRLFNREGGGATTEVTLPLKEATT